MDLSQYSDDELERIVNGGIAPQKPQATPDFSQMSDEELEKYANPVGGAKTETPSTSAAQTGLESYGNFMTLGYLPQLQALTEPVTNAIGNALTGANVDSGKYVDRRDQDIARQNLENKEHPYAHYAGMATGLGASLLMPGIGIGGRAAAEGASAAGRALLLARDGAQAGAIYGALSNPGDKKGEVNVLQAPDRLKNAAIGAASGAVINPLMDRAASAGQNLYKSAFKKIDSAMLKKSPDAQPFSETMWKNGVRGSTHSIFDQSENIYDGLNKARDVLYDQAASAGAKVDAEKALQQALAEAKRLQGVRGAEQTGKDLEQHIRSFYEPTDAPKVVGEYSVPGQEIQHKVQRDAYGNILNPNQTETSVANYNVSGQTNKVSPRRDQFGFPVSGDVNVNQGTYTVPGTSHQVAPRLDAHGFPVEADVVPNSANVSLPAQTRSVPTGRYERDPFTGEMRPVTREISETASQIPAGGHTPQIITTPDSVVPSAGYEAKSISTPDVQVGAGMVQGKKFTTNPTSVPIVENPQTRFNWETMQEEPVKFAPLSPREASEVKTRFYDTLPQTAYNGMRLKGDAKVVNKLAAKGFRQEIENQANQVVPGLGDQIASTNRDMGSILGAKKALVNEVAKAQNKNHFTAVDGMLAGAELANPAALKVLATKKGAEFVNSPFFRTNAGMGMNYLGNLGVKNQEQVIRGINQLSPWDGLAKKQSDQ